MSVIGHFREKAVLHDLLTGPVGGKRSERRVGAVERGPRAPFNFGRDEIWPGECRLNFEGGRFPMSETGSTEGCPDVQPRSVRCKTCHRCELTVQDGIKTPPFRVRFPVVSCSCPPVRTPKYNILKFWGPAACLRRNSGGFKKSWPPAG